MHTKGRRIMDEKKTRKNRSKVCDRNHIIKRFLEILNVVKLYHWKTFEYAEHKSTDDIHEKLEGHLDRFVEVYLGKDSSRITHWNKQMNTIQYDNSKNFKRRVHDFRDYVIKLKKCFTHDADSDLSNICDEILADINQFLYLLTLK